MKYRFNKLPKSELMAQVHAESFSRTSLSFYRYVKIENAVHFRDELYENWSKLGVLGRIYVSQEGINAQLNVPDYNFDVFRAEVDSHPELKDVAFKIGLNENAPSFWKLAIKAKSFILADGLDANEYDVTNVGNHLSAKEFNDAIDEGAVVVDMRNNYESDIGHFEGAICPDVSTFREELPVVLNELNGKEDQKVLLYCTGGIRCEKASAYLKHHGFNDVNQLHGGIIDYKHQVEQEGLESKYKGMNFVFDGRGSELVTEDILGKCYNCQREANTHVNCANQVCHILLIQCADCSQLLGGACSNACKERSLLPEDEQRKLRKGIKYWGRRVLR